MRFWMFLLTLLPFCASAQTEAGFTADRPGATTGVDVMPKGRVQWKTGIGYETDLIWSDAAKPTFFWGACLGFQLNDLLSLMAEEYNYNKSDGHENWVELGAAYMLTPHLQLDLATDISLNYPKRYFNLMVGVAWQITR